MAHKSDPVIKPLCMNCKWWRNKQAEIDYRTTEGFCLSPRNQYDLHKGTAVQLLDRKNKDNPSKMQKFESLNNTIPFGKVHESRYILVTEEEFGCINFTKQE
jgi:hypothetical protein